MTNSGMRGGGVEDPSIVGLAVLVNGWRHCFALFLFFSHSKAKLARSILMLNPCGSESDNSGSETAGTMCGWLTRWRKGVAAEVTKGHLRGFGFCHLGDLGNDDILFDSM